MKTGYCLISNWDLPHSNTIMVICAANDDKMGDLGFISEINRGLLERTLFKNIALKVEFPEHLGLCVPS